LKTGVRPRFVAVLALFAVNAWAALPDEIQVYTNDLEERGARGIELHINTTPSGRSSPDYPGEVTPRHGLRITPEISWGLGHDMDWGVYLPFVRSAEGTAYFAGPRFRLKWLPLRPAEGQAGAFAGINGELSFVQARFVEARRVLEIRPIVGYRGESWLVAFNPSIGTDLAGAGRGVVTFDPSLKVARDVGGRKALGVEYYAELGRLSHFAPRAEQAHTLYFVLDTQNIHFGIGRGLTGATDRWTIKSILSF
jgi:hypothetical protein